MSDATAPTRRRKPEWYWNGVVVQDRQVQHPVLFRPEQLLAIEEQNCHIAAIDNLQLGNLSGIARLRDLHPPALERFVQHQVV